MKNEVTLTNGQTVMGYWDLLGDEWWFITNTNIIPIHQIHKCSLVPWLPYDHFCQPYKHNLTTILNPLSEAK